MSVDSKLQNVQRRQRSSAQTPMISSPAEAVRNFVPESTTSPLALTSSSNGRTSGKPWKSRKSATVYLLFTLLLIEDLMAFVVDHTFPMA